MMRVKQRRIVIGIGNPDRGDDAAGCAVVERLRGAVPVDTDLALDAGEATALLSHFDGASAAFLVDASCSGAPAGTVRRFDVVAAPLPKSAFGVSTHGMGLLVAVELARVLGQLPPCCVVYAIEGSSFDVGTPLSPEVGAAVAEVARRLVQEMAEAGAKREQSDA